MGRAHVITISNVNAGSATRKYQNKLERLAREHPFIHHYPTGSVGELEGVLDDVHEKFAGCPLHLVKVSGDGGYHHLLSAIARHDLLKEYPSARENYFLPDAITVTPTGHGTQNVVAKRAGIKSKDILEALPALSVTGHDDTLDVELMRVTDFSRVVYGFMFATGPMIREGSRMYHEGKAGALSLLSLITKSALSLMPVVNLLPCLRRHYDALFSPTIETALAIVPELNNRMSRVSSGRYSNGVRYTKIKLRYYSSQGSQLISYGGLTASAETLALGPLRVWHKKQGKIHVRYGVVTSFGQACDILLRLVLGKALAQEEAVRDFHTSSFSLENVCWYSVDDEPYTANGPVDVSRAGLVRIPKLLTRRNT